MDNSLLAISPIDGRYKNDTEELNKYFSEFAYIKYRLLVEIKYLIALSTDEIIRKFTAKELDLLNSIFEKFGIKEAEKVKKIEEETKHDVKAIEYYLKEAINKSTLSDVSEFIHFGLTSEDINNIALRLMLKDINSDLLLRDVTELNDQLLTNYNNYKNIPMIARTHGQKAAPTSLGKEFLVFSDRFSTEIETLERINFRAKLNGAVGNYNALYFSFPKVNWKKFSKEFLNNFGLTQAEVTTQIAPYEDIVYFFQTIQRLNGIILDLNQDMWRYISDGYFIQENKKGEIGSSTMPQKINPILFENSEGNIVIANSLIEGFTNKLPTSRLQRDLSGSTISRNFGIAIAYSLIAYKNTIKGLGKLKANTEKIKADLNEDYSILSEAVQIFLKKEGVKNGYELLKDLTRGQKLNKEEWTLMINKLPISNGQKDQLKKLTPENYIGIQ